MQYNMVLLPKADFHEGFPSNCFFINQLHACSCTHQYHDIQERCYTLRLHSFQQTSVLSYLHTTKRARVTHLLLPSLAFCNCCTSTCTIAIVFLSVVSAFEGIAGPQFSWRIFVTIELWLRSYFSCNTRCYQCCHPSTIVQQVHETASPSLKLYTTCYSPKVIYPPLSRCCFLQLYLGYLL